MNVWDVCLGVMCEGVQCVSLLYIAPGQNTRCCGRRGLGGGGGQVLRRASPTLRGLPRGKGDTRGPALTQH